MTAGSVLALFGVVMIVCLYSINQQLRRIADALAARKEVRNDAA